jgi:hypothetical protein
MRLAQLARKVSVRSSEIVGFLARKGIIIEDNANSRVEDADAFSVMKAFAPALLEAERARLDQSAADLPAVGVVVPVQPDEVESPVDVLIAEPPVQEAIESNETQTETAFEVAAELLSVESIPEVKAPKVELKGLKVIGKIELPEPRKKETPPASELVEEEGLVKPATRDQRERSRDRDPRNLRKVSRTAKNPVAQERDRQAHEAAQKKQREVEEEKERRKKYYANRVKPSVPSRSIRLIDEPLSTLSEESPEKPKGLLRRFIHWLTTY